MSQYCEVLPTSVFSTRGQVESRTEERELKRGAAFLYARTGRFKPQSMTTSTNHGSAFWHTLLGMEMTTAIKFDEKPPRCYNQAAARNRRPETRETPIVKVTCVALSMIESISWTSSLIQASEAIEPTQERSNNQW